MEVTLTLRHGDCLEIMKSIPDKSVDLIICDLPYGCLASGFKGDGGEVKRFLDGKETPNKIKTEGGCSWDIKIPLKPFWDQIRRIRRSDHAPTIHFCTTKFGYELIQSNPDEFRYDLVWDKQRGVSFLSANKMPMRSHEMIYVFSKKGANYSRVDIEGDFPGTSPSGMENAGGSVYGIHKRSATSNTYPKVADAGATRQGIRCVKSVIEMSNKKGKGKHPTQKPNDLYEWLIARYSKEGDTILDPTAGSFASCFTAQRLGRNAIGMEKDEGFYNKANAVVK